MEEDLPKALRRRTARGPNLFLRRVRGALFQLLVFILLLLTFSLLWAQQNYGNITFDEIMFHLNMPLKGTADVFINSYLKNALLPAVFCLAAELLLMYPPVPRLLQLAVTFRRRTRTFQFFPLRLSGKMCVAVLCCWFYLLAVQAENSFSFFEYIRHEFQTSELIHEEYVDPAGTTISFPEQKRNLIWIYLESAETSCQDLSSGGFFSYNCIPEMTQLAQENISFSQSELIEGAAVAPKCGWTMAGLVAQTSGLLLKLPHHTQYNTMGQYEYFLPGATSLGEILQEAGYQNYFMAGSDFNFGGRTDYFTQHGNYKIFDYAWAIANEKIPSGYNVWWGFEDQKLYALAKEKLLEIAQKGEPFNFSLLTADTHHPSGYVCDLCSDNYPNQYANVWACASAQAYEFVRWIQEQDFYENTTVIITGDHCSMATGFYAADTKDSFTGEAKRKVYNTFIHPAVKPVQEKNRRFTTLDFFPTALASLGATIEGERLGLGTNLFSKEQTLSEKYGFTKLFTELDKKSRFYDNELLYPTAH